MADIRLICAQMLGRIIEEKMFFSDIKEQLPDQQKAFANMLVLTALRQYVRLNEVLQRYLHKKIARKNRMAQYLLINAAAELLYMQSKPYTVINETVNLVRLTTDKFLASMANAVLRKIASNAVKLRAGEHFDSSVSIVKDLHLVTQNFEKSVSNIFDNLKT